MGHSDMCDGGLRCRFVPHSQLWARYFAILGNNLMIGIPGKDRSYSDEGAQLAAYIIQNVTGTAVAYPVRSYICCNSMGATVLGGCKRN